MKNSPETEKKKKDPQGSAEFWFSEGIIGHASVVPVGKKFGKKGKE